MRLLTLEGLPKTCTDLARILGGGRGRAMITIPTSVSPTATSSTRAKADEIAACFANVLAKAKLLQRVATTSPTAHTYCCAHWIELPLAMSHKERCTLFEVFMDMSDMLLQYLDIPVDKHDALVLHTDPNECFESLLDTMEARDLTFHDLHAYLTFLKLHTQRRCSVRVLTCPPRSTENVFQLLRLGHTISHGLASYRTSSHHL